MKNTKRLLALLVALAMTASVMCITAFADEAAENTHVTAFTDDFEAYVTDAASAAELATTGGKYTTHVANSETGETEDSTNWYTSGYSNGYDGTARTGVIQDPTTTEENKVLAVEARSTYNGWASKPRVFNQVVKANNTDKYTYTFDFYKSTVQAGGGILFCYNGGNDTALASSNYYAVDFVGNGDHAYGYMVEGSELYSTVVVKNGAVQYDAVITTNPDKTATTNRYNTGEKDENGKDITKTFDTYLNDNIAAQKWFTASVSICAGKIEWTVTQKGVDIDSDGNDDVVQTGSWTDPNPIAAQPTMFALYGGGQGNTFMYYDNLTVEKTTIPFVEEGFVVPENAILYDNFNSYEEVYNTADYTIGKDVAVAGNWYNRTIDGYAFGGWSQDQVGTAIILNPSDFGKSITINAQTGWNPTSAGNMRPAAPSIEYSGVTMNQDDIYTYTFDIHRSSNALGLENAGGGIRFNYKGKDFYELYFMGNNGATDGTLKTQLSKVEGASWTVLQPDIDSTLANNKLLAKKWYTVSVTVEKGDIAWTVVEKATGTTVQTGSYKDNKPFRGEGFTMRLFAAGQGGEYVTFDNVLVTETKSSKPSLDDVHVTVEDGVYIYEESFGGYDSEDGAVATYTDTVSIIDSPLAVRANKKDLTVLKNDAGSWELSKAHSWQGFPGAFIHGNNSNLHLLGHQGQNSVTGGIADRYYPAVVNFKPATTGSVDLKELVIKGEKRGASRFGIRVAISEDEQSYYEFGRGDWFDTLEKTGYNKYAPYVVKCIDGVRTMVHMAEDTASINGENARTWTVTVDGSNITVNAQTAYVTDVYTYTFEDTDGLLEKMAYPFAVYSAAGAVFDGVTVKYVPDADVFVDNCNGTATITAVPARYLENGTSLKLVTAFYAENGTFISASENTLTEKGSYSINTPASYGYAKVMMYDGNSLVKEISTKEDIITVAEDKTVIACVGDSNTGNNGQITSDSWSTRIGAMLGEDYDVQNYGRAGYRLMNGYAVENGGNPSYTLSEEYAASLLSNPDIVIIMLGTNDGNIGTEGATRDKFKADYISLIETYKNLPTNPEIILTVPPIRGTAANPNHNADNIRPVIQELSQEYGYRYVDMTALVTDYSLLYDTLHFTDVGYFQFAEHFYNAVKKNVTSTVSADKASVIITADASFDSDIAVAVYKDGALTGVQYVNDAKVLSATDYTVDISALDVADGDKVKVMILNNEISPYTYAQTISNKGAYVLNGKALITGNTTPNAHVGVTVYNGTNLVYADCKDADRSGYYEFAPTLDAGTYTVIANGVSTTLTVE